MFTGAVTGRAFSKISFSSYAFSFYTSPFPSRVSATRYSFFIKDDASCSNFATRTPKHHLFRNTCTRWLAICVMRRFPMTPASYIEEIRRGEEIVGPSRPGTDNLLYKCIPGKVRRTLAAALMFNELVVRAGRSFDRIFIRPGRATKPRAPIVTAITPCLNTLQRAAKRGTPLPTRPAGCLTFQRARRLERQIPRFSDRSRRPVPFRRRRVVLEEQLATVNRGLRPVFVRRLAGPLYARANTREAVQLIATTGRFTRFRWAGCRPDRPNVSITIKLVADRCI